MTDYKHLAAELLRIRDLVSLEKNKRPLTDAISALTHLSGLEEAATKVAVWLEKAADQLDIIADGPDGFEGFAESCKSDAAGYRAAALALRTALSKPLEDQK